MEAWAISFTLILARVGAFVATQPLFGAQVPRLVKVGLTGALAVFWIGDLADPTALEVAPAVPWFGYVLAVGRESLLGGVLGFGLAILMLPIRTAGEFIGQEMGLSMASLSDPTSDNSATLVGQLTELLGITLFLGLDGHHVWLAALHGTFAQWPLGGSFSLPVVPLVSGIAQAHEWGLLLAMPLATCLFAASLLLALMARVAPQLNLMSIGFALKIAVGLGALIVFLPDFVAGACATFAHFTGFLTRLA